MSHLISKRQLIKIKEDLELLYCEANKLPVDSLYENCKQSEVVKKVGDYLHTLGWGETYARQGIYHKLKNLTDKEDDFQLSITKDFSFKISQVLGKEYWSLLTGELLSGSTSEAKKLQYRNTRWVYFYYDDPKGIPGVSTGVIYIDNNSHVFIKDTLQEIPKRIDYEGGLNFSLNGALMIMALNTKGTKERDLHIALQVGNYGTPPDVMIGQYHNVNSNGTIISGSIIVQSSKYTLENFKPTFFQKGTAPFSKLVPTVQRFFGNKSNNRIKIPNTGYTYSKLDEWIREKESSRRRIAVKHEQPRLFISAPTTSLDSIENFKLFKKFTTELAKVLKEKYQVEVSCTLLRFNNYEEFRESNILLKIIKEELDTCNYYMIIYPRLKLKRQSSMLLELGYMLSKPIPQIIMIEDGVPSKDIPNLLEGAITEGNIKRYRFANFADLISKVETNGLDLF